MQPKPRRLKVALIALLCALAACYPAQAEAGPAFPWHGAMLNVTLATCDQSLMSSALFTAADTPVLIELTSLGEPISPGDLDAGLDDFSLQDRSGMEYSPLRWLPGEGESGGSLPPQTRFSLLFLPEGQAANDLGSARLLVDTEIAGERMLVALSKAPSSRQATPEPIPATSPAPTPAVAPDFAQQLAQMETVTARGLFDAAYAAQGDPLRAYQAALTYAAGHQMLEDFLALQEDAVAVGAESKSYRALESFLEGYHLLGANDPTVPLQDEVLAALRDETAQYSAPAALWTLARLGAYYGVDSTLFTPAAPRPGYCLVVLDSDAHCTPDTKWSASSDARAEVQSDVATLLDQLVSAEATQQMGLTFTGNPDLASLWLVIDFQYPFHARYGPTGAIRGYDSTTTLTVLTGATREEIASFTMSKEQGDSITTSITSGMVWKYLPKLTEVSGQTATLLNNFYRLLNTHIAASRAQALNGMAAVTKGNAVSTVNVLLATLAVQETDPWLLAVYEAGAENAKLEDNRLTFDLCAFTPNLAALNGGQADVQTRLINFFAGTSAHRLAVTLTVQDGQLTQKNLTQLQNAVAQAVAASKSAFKQKAFVQAVKDCLMPSPMRKVKSAGDILTVTEAFSDWIANHREDGFGGEAKDWAPLFYGQLKQTLDLSGGPHALALRCVSVSPEALLSTARAAALSTIQAASGKQTFTPEAVRDIFREQLAEAAFRLRKNGKEAYALIFDAAAWQGETLPEGYADYLARYAFTETLSQLQADVSALPGAAS